MQRSPRSARRQRRALYAAHPQRRRRMMTVPLSRDLKSRFHRRSLPLRKGDTVRIIGGSYVGREERIAKVDRRAFSVTLENVTSKTGESKQTPLPMRTGKLILVRLNLSDPQRRALLKVTEEELTPEERGTPIEPPASEETTPAAPPPAAPESSPGSPQADAEEDVDLLAEAEAEEEEGNEDEAGSEDEAKPAPPKTPRRKRA